LITWDLIHEANTVLACVVSSSQSSGFHMYPDLKSKGKKQDMYLSQINMLP